MSDELVHDAARIRAAYGRMTQAGRWLLCADLQKQSAVGVPWFKAAVAHLLAAGAVELDGEEADPFTPVWHDGRPYQQIRFVG